MASSNSGAKAAATEAPLLSGVDHAVNNDMKNTAEAAAVTPKIKSTCGPIEKDCIVVKIPGSFENGAEESFEDETEHVIKPKVSPQAEEICDGTGRAAIDDVASQTITAEPVKNEMENVKSRIGSVVGAAEEPIEADLTTITESASSENRIQEHVKDKAEVAIKAENSSLTEGSEQSTETDHTTVKEPDSSANGKQEHIQVNTKALIEVKDQVDNAAAGASIPSQNGITDQIMDNLEDAVVKIAINMQESESGAPGASDAASVKSTQPQVEETRLETAGTINTPKDSPMESEVAVARNPDFAAPVKRVIYDKQKVLTKLAEDFEQSQRDQDLDELCTTCDKPAETRCGRCKCARYCSRQCQVADWSIHKKVCADFAGAVSDENRPSPEHRRILFFPMYADKPELLWAVCKDATDNEWLDFEHTDIDLFEERVQTEDMAQRKAHTLLNLMQTFDNRRIGHMLIAVTYTVDRPLNNPLDPELINKSICALSKPGYLRPWFGAVPIFADARLPDEPLLPKIIDIKPRDIQSVLRLFETCDCSCVADPPRYQGEVISALRINDIKTDLNDVMGIKTVFDQTLAPLSPVHNHDYVIVMAFHLGLRWYIRQGNFLGLKSNSTLWNDGNLRYLAYVCTFPEVVVDEPAQDGVGSIKKLSVNTMFNYGPFSSSVMVLHGSGNSVDMHHVLAFNAYLDEVYIRKEAASKKGFQKFWTDYKQKLGGAVSSVPSPYKWEKKGVVDRLGVYRSDWVMAQIARDIRGVWMSIINNLSNFTGQSNSKEVSRRRQMWT